MDKELEQGIDIYIKHIRKMQNLTDKQMALLMTSQAVENNETLETLNRMNPDIMNAINDQIKHVRKMQNLTDTKIKDVLLKSNMHEILREGALKRNLKDIAIAAKDISSNPKKFARKIDRF
jgi:hypothetical protein